MFGSWRKRKENPVLQAKQQANIVTNNSVESKNNIEHKQEIPCLSLDVPSISAATTESQAELSPTQLLHEEYERKIRVLSQCLSEKAEENITLQEKIMSQERRVESLTGEMESAKELEVVVTELNSILREKNQEYENYIEQMNKKDLERIELHQLTQEFQRRIRVLSTCLDEMAQENLGLHATPVSNKNSKNSPKHKDQNVELAPPVQKNSVEAKLVELARKHDKERIDEERVALESELSNVREDLINIEEKLQKKEKRILQLNSKLMDAINKKNSLSESNELYEEKLKSLERELTDNLQQESIRRQEAEYIASKLRKKEGELQFLLDDRDQDSDPYYSDEDSE